jgi:NAD+ synthase (glutamine-hydrolysing)
MSHLRIVGAQLDTVVGDLDGNVERVMAALEDAEAIGADLCVFPELTITGYPPEDLLLKPGFVRDNIAALERVASCTRRCTAVVGFVEPVAAQGEGILAEPRQHLANAAAICVGGRVRGIYRKRLLPNYGVFDEQRWFVAGRSDPVLYGIAGVRVGVSICEDVWESAGPVTQLGLGGAQVIVNLNASPYSLGRRQERLAMLRERVGETGCPIVYVNQVGGQDELVFDGASMVVASDGAVLASAAQFAESLMVVDLALEPDAPRARDLEIVVVSDADPTPVPPQITGDIAPELSPEAEVYEALVLGTRDYLAKSGFSDAVIGLSGGIDSALVAAVAVDALGAGHVHALSMPSRYSSDGSKTDAHEVARRLGIELFTVPIEALHSTAGELLDEVLGGPPSGLTDENLQSRLRGLTLMAVSNARGWMVLTTGNKSELATGYFTLYGDSVGGFAAIKDLPKTLLYKVCRYRNALSEGRGELGPVPEEILVKPPSAELRPDQRDEDSLPAYETLDPLIQAYVEDDRTAAELIADGYDADSVERVVRLVDGAEYKRRQMPPGVRLTRKAFGKDRRMPITNHYRGSGRTDSGTGTDAVRSD